MAISDQRHTECSNLQRVLNKLSKKHNIRGHKWSMTYRVLKSLRSKMGVIYA